MTEPVAIGTAVVAFIEPHPGQAAAFNRWYEGDHFYAAVTAGPGVFSGGRWVATRACKAARPPGRLLGDPARGSYLTTAWVLDGMQAEWDEWVAGQMRVITEQGRLFPGRDHVHTAVYRTLSVRGPATYALDRCYPGLVAVATRAPAAEVAAFCAALGLPAVVSLAPERVVLSEAQPGDHLLVLGFVEDADVLGAWRDRVEPALASLPPATFASPFLRTVPGTDTYTDDV